MDCFKQIIVPYIQALKMVLSSSYYEMDLDLDQWKEFYRLSKQHNLEIMLYCFAKEQASAPEGMMKALDKIVFQLAERDELETRTIELIKEIFNDEKIPVSFIKGAVVKNDYPESYMRSMSDIDVYINRDEKDTVLKVCSEKLGVNSIGADSGDITITTSSRIHIDFQGRLFYKKSPDGIIGYASNKRLAFDSENGEAVLSNEEYALNLIGHMVNNLASGGLGIRYILDLWVYRNRHTPQPDWKAVMSQLNTDGIGKVAQNLIELSDLWFGSANNKTDMTLCSPLLKELSVYIFGNGPQGGLSNVQISRSCFLSKDIILSKNQVTRHAIKYGIVRSKEEFMNRYSWLETYPFLLPIAWLIRIITSIIKHPKEVIKEIKQAFVFDDSQLRERKDQLKRFGIL